MRRLLVSVLVALSLLALRAPVHATDDLVFGFFADYLESLRAQAGIPGMAAAIVGANDIIWKSAFGQQNIEQSLATNVDTPFEIDGLMQIVDAAVILRCVEEGRFSLDDPISKFDPNNPYAGATIRQIMTHTSMTDGGVTFLFSPDRLSALSSPISSCTGTSFRATIVGLLDRLAMTRSVPGLDAVGVQPPSDGITDAAIQRYRPLVQSLATPYTVNGDGQASVSQYTATTLQLASGLISTVLDIAQIDLALKQGILLRQATLDAAWRPPVGQNGQPLPHGLGWFAQTYTNGQPIVWQFGESDNASSSLVITLPQRQLTLILLANSDRLVTPFTLATGELTSSPFARVFLGILAR